MVYLLCFHQHYKHARHYIGFCKEGGLDARIEKHRKGSGARLMEVITKAGIGFDVARVWSDGDRTFERKLKNMKNAKRLCPFCNNKPKIFKAVLSVDIETSHIDPSKQLTPYISYTIENIQDSYDPTKPFTVATP